MEAQLIKAFTIKPEEGNPAGVILSADRLSREEMVSIAAKLGYSESVFVVESNLESADYRFRFMTGTTEVDACGHATLAGAFAIDKANSFERIKIETGAGMVEVGRKTDGSFLMKMAKAELGQEKYSKSEIAKLIGTDEHNILDLPLITSSVGSPKLMIPLKSLEVVKNLKPNFELMIEFCKDNPVKGFYTFTSETVNKNIDFHARQFNPAVGIPEDPITGIAGGALILYAREYHLTKKNIIRIEQGIEMNKPGQIIAEYRDGVVFVGGNAVKFGELEL